MLLLLERESIQEPWHLWRHLNVEFEYTKLNSQCVEGARDIIWASLINPDYLSDFLRHLLRN